MLTDAEQKLLQAIRRRHIIRKNELAIMEGDASAAARSLVDKGLLQVVSPLGESCYAITQKGLRFAEGKV